MRPPEKYDHLFRVPSLVVSHRFDCISIDCQGCLSFQLLKSRNLNFVQHYVHVTSRKLEFWFLGTPQSMQVKINSRHVTSMQLHVPCGWWHLQGTSCKMPWHLWTMWMVMKKQKKLKEVSQEKIRSASGKNWQANSLPGTFWWKP